MEKLLFIVLAVTEIVLVIRSIRTNTSKKEWSLSRAVANVAELFIYLIMLILPGIDFSFRFKGLFILLVIRLLVSVIVVAATRKNEKIKKPVSIVCGTLFGIILIAVSMIPAFIFRDYVGRPVSGQYSVAQSRAILIDETRLE